MNKAEYKLGGYRKIVKANIPRGCNIDPNEFLHKEINIRDDLRNATTHGLERTHELLSHELSYRIKRASKIGFCLAYDLDHNGGKRISTLYENVLSVKYELRRRITISYLNIGM